MDPLSITASVVAILQLTGAVLGYVGEVNGGSKERQMLLVEIGSTKGLLETLKILTSTAAAGDPWLATVSKLCTTDGSLKRLERSLAEIEAKTKPKKPGDVIVKAVVWPFQRKEVATHLQQIEREKSLISIALQYDSMELARAIKNDVQEGARFALSAAKGVQEIQTRAVSDESKQIITWLSPLNFWVKQRDVFSARLEGTAEWLFQESKFQDWVSWDTRILWCPGIPGAGKTVLASAVVDYLQKTVSRSDIAITFMYCSYQEQEDQSVANLIASVLQQIVQNSGEVSSAIKKIYENHSRKRTRPISAEFMELLNAEAGRLKTVYLVVDALDECSNQSGRREQLLEELRSLPKNVKVMITSRHVASIEAELSDAVRLEIRGIPEDVNRYVQYRLQSEPRLSRYTTADPSLRDTILDTICQKADGMFLLARLHVDALARKHNRRDIRIALCTLPSTINDTYEEAWKRILSQDEDDVDLAKRVLSTISHAYRPLQVAELQTLLAINPEDDDVDEEAVTDVEILTSVCAGLVNLEQESKCIRLVHYTAQVFFETQRSEKFPSGHLELARTCLKYLLFESWVLELDLNSERTPWLRKYGLLHYAALFWGDHAREADTDEIDSLILPFLSDPLRLSYVANHFWRSHGLWQDNVGQSGLYVAIVFGLTRIIESAFTGPESLRSSDYQRFMTPLHCAALFGRTDILELLLAKGVGVDNRWSGQTALHLAARKGHENNVSLLLDHGADHALLNFQRLSALHVAALHQQPIGPFLKRNATMNRYAIAFDTTLMTGNSAVGALLISTKGTSIEEEDSGTLLQIDRSTRNEHWNALKDLLVLRRDIDFKTRLGAALFSEAVARAPDDFIQFMLDRGVDVNHVDCHGETPLLSAFRAGNMKNNSIVSMLITHGADVQATANDGETALHFAVQRNDSAIVRTLLQNGARTDAKVDGKPPILFLPSSSKDNEWLLEDESVSALIEYGADIDAKDEAGDSLLHHAIYKSAQVNDIISLLEYGVSINSYNKARKTPLHVAVEHCRRDLVEVLLNKGADPGMSDRDGLSPLQKAMKQERLHTDLIIILFKHDSSLRSGASVERLLRIALRHREFKFATELVDLGIDVKQVNNSGVQPLLLALFHGAPSKFMKLLIKKGVDPSPLFQLEETLKNLELNVGFSEQSFESSSVQNQSGAKFFNDDLGMKSALDVADRLSGISPDLTAEITRYVTEQWKIGNVADATLLRQMKWIAKEHFVFDFAENPFAAHKEEGVRHERKALTSSFTLRLRLRESSWDQSGADEKPRIRILDSPRTPDREEETQSKFELWRAIRDRLNARLGKRVAAKPDLGSLEPQVAESPWELDDLHDEERGFGGELAEEYPEICHLALFGLLLWNVRRDIRLLEEARESDLTSHQSRPQRRPSCGDWQPLFRPPELEYSHRKKSISEGVEAEVFEQPQSASTSDFSPSKEDGKQILALARAKYPMHANPSFEPDRLAFQKGEMLVVLGFRNDNSRQAEVVATNGMSGWAPYDCLDNTAHPGKMLYITPSEKWVSFIRISANENRVVPPA